jgi:hypothetical protein
MCEVCILQRVLFSGTPKLQACHCHQRSFSEARAFCRRRPLLLQPASAVTLKFRQKIQLDAANAQPVQNHEKTGRTFSFKQRGLRM